MREETVMAIQGEIVVSAEYADGEGGELTACFGLFMPVRPRIGEVLTFETTGDPGVGIVDLELRVTQVRHVFAFGDTHAVCVRRTEVDTQTSTLLPGKKLAALLLRHSAVLWVDLGDGKGERRTDRERPV